MELGVFTFGETAPDAGSDRAAIVRQRYHDLIEEIVLADQVGLDVFGVGEHHRPDYVVSAPAIVLGAAAVRTKRIRLTSAVTVLSSDDPVRVFQQFATVDLLSGGRAEIMAGRGSFIESFPLFGYDLRHYDELFAENLELLLRIRQGERVTWQGQHRAPLDEQGVYPRPVQTEIPIWVAVGGTPGSATRAGTRGLPMAIAIIGGESARFASFASIHREAAERAGHPRLPISINSHGFIARDSQDAADEVFPSFKTTMDRIGRERRWPPLTREQFEHSRRLEGANFVGSPQEVIDKIMYQYEIFRHDRFLLQFTVGPLSHASVMRSIELFGTEVAPVIRRETGGHAVPSEVAGTSNGETPSTEPGKANA